MKPDAYQRMLDFLARLDAAGLAYSLDHVRDEAIMVTVAVPGEHWEVEYLSDGTVDVERYVSTGDIRDETALDELFAVHTG